jgi:hypothetical protein
MAGFMVMQVWREPGVCCETPDGEQTLPVSVVDANSYKALYVVGGLYWAEYSAPGYMDRTDPVCGATPAEVINACFDLYGNEEDEAEVKERDELLARYKGEAK